MSFRIYYTDRSTGHPAAVDRDHLTVALDKAALLRNEGHFMVTIVANDQNLVGKQGVDSVKNGKLPDGTDYDWTKRDRVGSAFKNK